ncbi:hypothetical protein SELMODRAFT_419593 [Selaginella moellendorffii]|uniref:SPX domain-containing protein n=1 Tax=Selaginella moellendorffii TaxID=88036 RepID=D8S9F5_SELML|nr:hypothetical protein SELMODRAFT_419593 [Selaginella moellendorffii]
MVKFQKQLVPEWRVKYCDYKQLKKAVKRIKNQILHTKNQEHKVFDPNVFSVDKSKLQNLLQNPSAILSSCCEQSISSETSMVCDDVLDCKDKTKHFNMIRLCTRRELEMARIFTRRSCSELDRITKRASFSALTISSTKWTSFLDARKTSTMLKHSNFTSKWKSSSLCKVASNSVALNLELFDLCHVVDDESQSLKGSPGNKGKVQRAAKMLQTAFVEFYRGLRLLRNFSSLNMMAFVKILKKYDKLSEDGRNSHFATLDKVVKFMDHVERVFTLHFTKGNRKQAMAYLRPIHSASNHGNINFILGLFSGCSWSLLAAFVLILVLGNKDGITTKHIQAVFPMFSTLFLFVLHLYMYGMEHLRLEAAKSSRSLSSWCQYSPLYIPPMIDICDKTRVQIEVQKQLHAQLELQIEAQAKNCKNEPKEAAPAALQSTETSIWSHAKCLEGRAKAKFYHH